MKMHKECSDTLNTLLEKYLEDYEGLPGDFLGLMLKFFLSSLYAESD